MELREAIKQARALLAADAEAGKDGNGWLEGPDVDAIEALADFANAAMIQADIDSGLIPPRIQDVHPLSHANDALGERGGMNRYVAVDNRVQDTQTGVTVNECDDHEAAVTLAALMSKPAGTPAYRRSRPDLFPAEPR